VARLSFDFITDEDLRAALTSDYRVGELVREPR
jgi:hypothetical protein